MAVIYFGSTLNGTATDDFLIGVPNGGASHTINGNDGNDLIYGDHDNLFLTSGDSAVNALDVTHPSYSSVWGVSENTEILNSTTVPHTTVYVDPTAGTTRWLSVNVVAGQTITLDVDFGGAAVGGVTDTLLRLIGSDGTTVLASNDDGGSGVFDVEDAIAIDSFLNYTFVASGTYYIQIAELGTPDIFEGDEAFLLNVSLTGQDYTGQEPIIGDDFLYGGNGDDTIHGAGGIDTIYGGANNDTIVDGGNNAVFGSDGNDHIVVTMVSGGTWDGGNDFDTLDLTYTNFSGQTYNLGAASFSMFGATFFNFENVDDGSGSNTIIGNSAPNRIIGGKGDDIIFGGGGTDTLLGGDDEDTIEGGGGADLMLGGGGVGGDTLSYAGSSAAVTIDLSINFASGGDATGDAIGEFENVLGSGHADVITGSALRNSLFGGLGEDILKLNGVDADVAGEVYDGGGGNDTLRFTNTGTLTHNLRNDTVTSIEVLSLLDTSGTGSRTILLNANQFSGSGIALNAQIQLDFLTDNTETFDIVMGTSTSLNLSSLSFFGSSANSKFIITGDGNGESITGTNIRDILTGAGGVDGLYGGGDSDTLYGGADNDFLYGGAGADVLYGGTGANALFGGTEDDTFFAGSGSDTMHGQGGLLDIVYYSSSAAGVTINLATQGNAGGDAQGDALIGVERVVGTNFADTISGDAQANSFLGGAGIDALYGAAGADVLYGGTENDNLFGGAGGDVLDGGEGTLDFAYYTTSTAAVTVNLANNINSGGDALGDQLYNIERLSGSGFGDTLTGNSGANTIYGQQGADTINGGLGQDILYGGINNDTFRFTETNFGADVIVDFTDIGATTDDRLSFALSVADSFSDFTFVGNGSTSVTVTIIGGQTFTVRGPAAITLDAGDFVFV